MSEINDSLAFQSATQLLDALQKQKISSLELVEETIKRIEKVDQKINSVVVRDFEQSRTAAKAADEARSKGESKALLGLPMTVKESFNVLGMPSTWGNPEFKNCMPKEEALVVSRLKQAGAVIIGKTNVPFMLSDWQSYNEIYGVTNNPWDPTKTPGGSSGGSAAALAAGLISLELGSDLAGSLRVPAHFCGIFTHKPTFGLLPLRGNLLPQAKLPGFVDFTTAGPMARSASDLLLEFQILAGPDPLTEGKAYTLSLPLPKQQKLADFRVLLLSSHPLCPTDEDTQHSFDELYEKLEKVGVKVDRQLPNEIDLKKIATHYEYLLAAFLSTNMTPQILANYKNISESIGSDDASLVAYHLKGFTTAHYDWLQISRARAELLKIWRSLYQQYDVVICPVMPTAAFPHNFSDIFQRQVQINNQTLSYWDQKVWISMATFFGLPATVFPIAIKNGLPIGAQIIGDSYEDLTTIHFSHLFEKEFGGFTPPSQL